MKTSRAKSSRKTKGSKKPNLTGSLGEMLAGYELAKRDWLVANLNTLFHNSPNVDFVALKGKKAVLIQIKSSANGNFQFSGQGRERIFNRKAGPKAAFVIFVILNYAIQDGLTQSTFYIVPVSVAERAITRAHQFWLRFPKRDGSQRRDSMRGIGFSGSDSPTNIARDFARKWAAYKDAWHLL
jgi:hypothetical protein